MIEYIKATGVYCHKLFEETLGSQIKVSAHIEE